MAELALDTREVTVSSVTVNGEGDQPGRAPCLAAEGHLMLPSCHAMHVEAHVTGCQRPPCRFSHSVSPALFALAAAEFSLAEPHKALGSRLAIKLPAGLKAGEKLKVRDVVIAWWDAGVFTSSLQPCVQHCRSTCPCSAISSELLFACCHCRLKAAVDYD